MFLQYYMKLLSFQSVTIKFDDIPAAVKLNLFTQAELTAFRLLGPMEFPLKFDTVEAG